jgi:ABC-type uncharacterized transport system permease subunit
MKHWQDSTNAALGAWLIVSPLALGFQGDWIALVNTAIVGVLLVSAALGAIFVPQAWEEWTETALGLWLAMSPWVLRFDSQMARINDVVIGLLVLTLALWALQDHEAQAAEKEAAR